MATSRPWGSTDDETEAAVDAFFGCGSNTLLGAYEYSIGDENGQFLWGGSTNTLDSGVRSFELEIKPAADEDVDRTVTWSIDSGTPLSVAKDLFDSVTKVGVWIRVTSSSSFRRVRVLSMTVTFYDDGNSTDIFTLPDPMVASSGTPPIVFQKLDPQPMGLTSSLIIEPTITARRVKLTGTIRLEADSTTPPATSIQGNLYLWTDAFSAVAAKVAGPAVAAVAVNTTRKQKGKGTARR